ncbi:MULTISPECIES: hypothetical protein [unclassified Achromobacter]|uniref:hypothetical protein n=1 Tax=unclassified Achromobacter TaxID=2626865 RepID=UPI00069D2464|nr:MULTISPECIES: hypothetical protein [unclassified Achromobacter]KOF52297.1 hypothetical protein AD428_21165 [Achromobacter sp. DMS1]
MECRGHRIWIAVLAVAAATAASAQNTSAIVVDGNKWLSADYTERRAFLVGVANMIIAEDAYARREKLSPPPAGTRITAAVKDLNLYQIDARITQWYQAHPDRRGMPVMGVIWQDIVKRQAPMQGEKK